MQITAPLKRSYAVFLSYRHADNTQIGRQWATWLHQVLEGYEVPEDLVGTQNTRGERIPQSLYPVFRDEEELPADADLTRNIRVALKGSALLVVLCSPRAVQSKFVADEIRFFKELGRGDRILAVMLDGEPNASIDAAKEKGGIELNMECLPEPLRFGLAGPDGKIDWTRHTEPIAADVRPGGRPEQGWTTSSAYRGALEDGGKLSSKQIVTEVRDYERRLELAKLKVIAGALSLPLGVLTKRDKAMQLERARQRARTLRRWFSAVAALAVGAIIVGIYALKQRDLVLEREAASRKTASLAAFTQADQSYKRNDRAATYAYLAAALRNDPSNSNAIMRIVALSRDHLFPLRVFDYPADIKTTVLSSDARLAMTLGRDEVSVWEVGTGRLAGPSIRYERVEEYKGQGPFKLRAARLSADGKRIAVVYRNTARIWNVETGKPVTEPIVHEGTVLTAGFSRDGKHLVTTQKWGTGYVWDATSGKLERELPFTMTLWDALFSPDGKWVATLSGKEGSPAPPWRMEVWEWRTGRAIGSAVDHNAIINSMCFSPSGKMIVTASADGTARIWDARGSTPTVEIIRHDGGVKTATFSPDETRIATASTKGTVQIFDVPSAQFRGGVLPGNDHDGIRLDSDAQFINFSPDGKRLITSTDTTARVWDVADRYPITEEMRLRGTLWGANFSQNGKEAIFVSDKGVQAWDARARPVNECVRHVGAAVWSSRFSPDGTRIVTSSSNGARVWDVRTAKAITPLLRHTHVINCAEFSPDGKRVVTGSLDGTARVWEAQGGRPITEPLQTKGSVISARFSPDGLRVFTLSGESNSGEIPKRRSNIAKTWDANNGKLLEEPLRNYSPGRFATFSPEGGKVATVFDDGSVGVLESQSGKTVLQIKRTQSAFLTVAFDPSGRLIVTTAEDNTVRMWDVSNGRPLSEPLHHEHPVVTAAIAPDGKRILTVSDDTVLAADDPTVDSTEKNSRVDTVSNDSTARMWDVPTGKAIGEPMRHSGMIIANTFAVDGAWVLTASYDGTARIWDGEGSGALSEPIIPKGGLRSASMSADDKWVVTSQDLTARIWELPARTNQAPSWLLDLAETVGGLHLNARGALEPSDMNWPTLREHLRRLEGTDDLTRFARWFATDPGDRTVTPLSPFKASDFVALRLEENNAESFEEAYTVMPDSPPLIASLATFEKNSPERATFLFRHALKRARFMGDKALVERVKSIILSAQPSFVE